MKAERFGKNHPATFNHEKQTQDQGVPAGAVSSAFKELCKKCSWKCTFALGSILNRQQPHLCTDVSYLEVWHLIVM